VTKSQTIGILAVKGGVGKTTTVANLAATLVKEYGKKVLAVDANYSAPNLGLHLGIIDPVNSLHDVLNDKVDIEDAIIKHRLGFDILPASLSPKKVNPYKLKNRLDKIKQNYDVILLDSSPTQNEEMLSTIVASDSVVVVTSPDFPSLSCALQAIKASKNKTISGVVINKSYGKKFELSAAEIEGTAGVSVLGVLAHDQRSMEALSKQLPLVAHKPGCSLSRGYTELAGRLIGETPKKTSIFSSMFDFFRPLPEPEEETIPTPTGIDKL